MNMCHVTKTKLEQLKPKVEKTINKCTSVESGQQQQQQPVQPIRWLIDQDMDYPDGAETSEMTLGCVYTTHICSAMIQFRPR